MGTAGEGFFEWDGLIYRRCTPAGMDEGETSIDQSASCRKAVLQLAHAILLAGHMGRKKSLNEAGYKRRVARSENDRQETNCSKV